MTKNYSALHESMQTRTLANGLRICYLPKEGFSKTFAILATDLRTAMHCRNSLAPVQVRTPSRATP